MSTTPNDLIVAALATSAKNRPDYLATKGSELLALVNRLVDALFLIGSRVNPEFFGASAPVAHDGTGWPRPTDALVVYLLERQSDLEEIGVVGPRDRSQALAPYVYELGGRWLAGAAQAGQLVPSDEVVAWYSRRPTAPSVVTDALDGQWPEVCNPLLVSLVAHYLARKDNRTEELPDLVREIQAGLAQFCHRVQNSAWQRADRFAAPRPVGAGDLAQFYTMLTGEVASPPSGDA
jgi:hypothetical protein